MADPKCGIDGEKNSAVEVEEDEKRAKFGTRFLTDEKNVFQHNAWDNVVWDEEQEEAAQKIVESQKKTCVTDEKREEYESKADSFWDTFYGQHQNRFFKDRHWLFTEFPELYGQQSGQTTESTSKMCGSGDTDDTLKLAGGSSSNDTEKPGSDSTEAKGGTESSEADSVGGKLSHLELKQLDQSNTPFRLLEVGCGVGNTVFPVLQTNNNPNLMMYCCDFSSTAIQIVTEHPDYNDKHCHAFVYDITDENSEMPIEKGSLDVIILIFVLSAVNPNKMQGAINRLASYLKPGGVLLFRDYGCFDMAQLRFKQGRCISDNFYVRGDGTRVYFFKQDELKKMFEEAGLVEKENLIDRRLQVNRGRQLKMYRVWIQCKYVRPLS